MDKNSRPATVHYSLSGLEMLIAVELRVLTWWALDEITEAINIDEPEKIRSAVYRTFVREGINKVPQKDKDKAKKFKEYEPGYLHIDVTYLPKINGIKYYLFVAIDRASRTLYYKVYEAKTSANANDFANDCLDFFPFPITHILTVNGLEFTNRLIKSKKGEYCKKPSKLDVFCQSNNIDHRLTKPFTPKTNGIACPELDSGVEKANDIIKNGTIKKSEYENIEQMNKNLMAFLVLDNLYRRHGSLRRELKEIFKEKPLDFKNKILLLKYHEKTSCQQQPCET